jgi:ABC-type glycerol-3-phosphate transport system substrate-binding protein
VRRTLFGLLVLALAAGLGLAACGGGKDEGAKAKEEASGGVTCEGSALSGDTGLPASFPKPDGVTYVKSEQSGPTRVVNAYYEGDLESAYDDYKGAFESAGYDIPFDEKEDNDAEVSYDDSTTKTTGLVALKAECDNDRISVRITSRAA